MRGFRAVLALMGFSAVIAQVLLLRELMVFFAGNELSLGLMLAVWLLWTALGSALPARFRNPRRAAAWLELGLSAALPLTILAVRAFRGSGFSPRGELLGPGATILLSAAALAPFCLLSGWLFAAGTRWRAKESGESTAEAGGSVYWLEGAGSACGGLLASWLLLPCLSPLQIAALSAGLNVLAAVLLGLRPAGLAWLALLPLAWPGLETATRAWLWPGFRICATADTAYGSLAVLDYQGTRSFAENGLIFASAPDPAAAEEAVHYALLQHPRPGRVLLLGGGLNGAIQEALRHPSVTRIEYVELDPAVIALGRRWGRIPADPRLILRSEDGRRFLRTSRERFDVIAVNLPEPQTAQLNRFYTAEFFEQAAAHLAPAGVFSFQIKGAANYINPQLARLLATLRKTLGEAFLDVKVTPGETIHFFTSSRPGGTTTDPQLLLERLRQRGIRTAYLREYFLPFEWSRERQAGIEEDTRPRPDTPVNRDLTPVAYYLSNALWGARFRLPLPPAIPFGWCLAVAALGLVLPRRPAVAAGYAAAAMGFTQMGLQMLLLLGFQAAHGFVYRQMAGIIAGVMAGLSLGAWLACSRPGRLVRVQLLAAAAPLAVCAVLLHTPSALYPVLALGCGVLGGYQFPLASRLFFQARPQARPGSLYALDLAGACLGALALSVYLVPLYGFVKAAAALGVLNLAAALSVKNQG